MRSICFSANPFPRSRILKILCLTLLLIPLASAYGNSAVIEGIVIKIPVLTVEESTFSVDLTLILGSDPITFDLTAAAEVTGVDTSGASTFAGITLTIPTIQVGPDNLKVMLVLSSDNPIQFQLSGFEINSSDSNDFAFDLFTTGVSSQIIDTTCIICHVANGVAPAGGSTLVFERSSDTSLAANFDAFNSFVTTRSDALEYILKQVTGGTAEKPHTGGALLGVGSDEYNNLHNFLDALINNN